MINVDCKALNWMAKRAREYLRSSDGEEVSYQFRGNLPYNMLRDALDWMKAQPNVEHSDGRSRSGEGLVLVDRLDGSHYRRVSIHLSSGSYSSTATRAELLIIVTDCYVSDDDRAEMLASGRY